MGYTFYARGDSSTANNSSINSQNTSQVPVTELTFEPATGGDITLDYNNGLSDPDTVMFVNGVQTTFTVEFTGELPFTNKFRNVNGEDLRGEPVIVITDDATGQRYYFFTDRQVSFATMNAFPNGSVPVGNVDEMPPPTPICFATGTPIETPEGPVPVEDLRPGDLVRSDAGALPLLWTGASHVTAADMARAPMLRAVRIGAGALAAGCPSRPVTVSANHRICLEGWGSARALRGAPPRVLVAAKHLAGRPGIDWIAPAAGVTLHHLLLSSHRLVIAAGLRSESFSCGPEGMRMLSPADRAAVEAADFRTARPGLPALPRVLTRLEALALPGPGALAAMD